ncbi:MAG: allene oxide cyclase family protein [Actinomycetota bacterium]
MRKTLFVGALAALLVAGALTISFAGTRAVVRPMRVAVREHALTDTVINTGKKGDSSGDLLTFHNPIFDATSSHKVGHDQGDCIRISPKAGTWECRWLTYIAGHGAIMVEGAFFDGRNSTLAVTGGTQQFRNARGSMKLVSRHGGKQFDFIFNLLP